MVLGFLRRKKGKNKKKADEPYSPERRAAELLAIYAGAEENVDMNGLINDLLRDKNLDRLSDDLFRDERNINNLLTDEREVVRLKAFMTTYDLIQERGNSVIGAFERGEIRNNDDLNNGTKTLEDMGRSVIKLRKVMEDEFNKNSSEDTKLIMYLVFTKLHKYNEYIAVRVSEELAKLVEKNGVTDY